MASHANCSLRLRKRGMTRKLLGDEYKEVISEVLDPPKPLSDIWSYTPDRIRDGLKYADFTLRYPLRNLSPPGERALTMYKESCATLLQLLDVEEGEVFEESVEERKDLEEEHRVFIREAERSIQINGCMRLLRTESAQEMQDEILKLQRLAFYSRYGDYLSGVCNDVKTEAETGKVLGWELLTRAGGGKFWSDIARRVENERPVYEKFLDGVSDLQPEMPNTYVITNTCYRLGLNPNDILEIIKQYGIRNQLVHADLLPLIKGGKFQQLAKRLWQDYTDLPVIIPATAKSSLQALESLLSTMIDGWFKQDELNPQEHEMWYATDELRGYYERLNTQSKKTENDLNKEIQKDITKDVKANLKTAAKHDDMVKLFGKISGHEKLPPKRVASAQYAAEKDRCKRMKLEWTAIHRCATITKEKYDTYVLAWGEDHEPRDVVEDKDLEE